VTASTGSPTRGEVTPAPTSATTPATSNPGVIGQPTYFFAEAYSPMRTTQSA
jgi:hypothetical protein